jgi:hypothetical protein
MPYPLTVEAEFGGISRYAFTGITLDRLYPIKPS